MADTIVRSNERDELHKSIWSIAEKLRGSVDSWDFKTYVLGTMFYRYVSEALTEFINQGEWDAGNEGFDYAKISDEEAIAAGDNLEADLIASKGYFILPSELFCNVVAQADKNDDLNETLHQAFSHIEASAKKGESAKAFDGLFSDFDVNSPRLGANQKKRLSNLRELLRGIASMPLGEYKGKRSDAFGDAYEYLMGMYASNAGKSGGEYFTPPMVAELLSHITMHGRTSVNKIYDPACGSGSLLLRAAKVVGMENVTNGFYGQEINLTTYNLCRINMFVHGVNPANFDIACEDTLLHPAHWDEEPMDVIVSNPPYSIKWAGSDDPTLINDPRFSDAGVLAPKSKADLAFVMHSLHWLSASGTAAIVCFPGILYRGGAEAKIREYLVKTASAVDAVIQLGDNLFYGTSISTVILVLRKGRQDNNVLFIDASKEVVKVTNNNIMTEENIQHLMKIYTDRVDVPHVAHVASLEEIEANKFNLSVSTYVTPEDTREEIDIVALNKEIARIVAREQELRDGIDRIIAELEGDCTYDEVVE